MAISCPKTHGRFTYFYAVWKPYLIEFVNTLDSLLDTAAE